MADLDRVPADFDSFEWRDIWSAWRDAASARPNELWVFDGRSPIPAAAWEGLAAAWAAVRGQALPLRLIVLVGPGSFGRLGDLPHDHVVASAVDAWDWAESLTAWSPEDRVRAAAIFGSEDRFRTLVDPGRSLGRNVRTLVLGPDAPMATIALDRIRNAVQRPDRYIRVTRAVAEGASEWGEIRTAVGGLAGSGQLGPYMRTLEQLGAVRSERSLDASVGSRAGRYRVADPWLGFWYACVMPSWSRLGVVDPTRLWRSEVRPRLDAHVERTLPLLVAQWLRTPIAHERLGSRARESGRLWGDGYEIQVAATLGSGAMVYGWTRWSGEPFSETELAGSASQLRSTRHGFGRERRLRLFVQRERVDHDTARLAARDPEMLLLSVADLIGEAGSPS